MNTDSLKTNRLGCKLRHTRYALIIMLLVHTLHSYAFNYSPLPLYLSSEAQISFVACEPGDEIYTVFGHAAIRVFDPRYGLDECFHWGIFDYNTPNFAYRFVKGETDYEMGIYPTNLFLLEYLERQSSVYEAVLNLSPEEKQKLYKSMLINFREENRKYRYNYVFDNCSTRPINLILSCSDDISTPANNPLLPFELPKGDKTTFRDMIEHYDSEGSPLSIGIDIMVATPADKKISSLEATAFPLYAMDFLENSSIRNEKLVSEVNTMNIGIYRDHESKSPFRFIAWGICALIICLSTLYYRKKKLLPKITYTIFLSIGMMFGVLVFFLMFVSEHPLVDNNFNIFWLNPLYFVLIAILFKKQQSKATYYCMVAFSAMCAIAAIGYIFQIQDPCSPIIALFLVYSTIVLTTTHYVKRSIKQ